MDQKEQELRNELSELDERFQDPGIFSDKGYPKLAKRKSELESILALFETKEKLTKDRASALELINSADSDMRTLAETELAEIEERIKANEEELLEVLTPQDPNNSRDVIIEIRA